MKKKLIALFLTLTALVLLAAAAHADGSVDACDHANMSEWMYYNGTSHCRYCLDCYQNEIYADHQVEGGLCFGTCTVCGESNSYTSGGKHTMSDWIAISDTEHVRYCNVCFADSTRSYAPHTGGAATCKNSAICDDCGNPYGAPDPDNHTNMSGWKYYSNTQHYLNCQDCGQNESYADHQVEGGLCFGTCTVCGNHVAFAPGGKHTMTDWTAITATEHQRYCSVCLLESTTTYAPHTGGTSTCASGAICDDCGEEYGSPDFTNHINMATDWYYIDNTRHAIFCIACGHHDSYTFQDHYGGAVTCMSQAICEGCGEAYGNTNPNNHDYITNWYGYDDKQHFRYCNDCGEAWQFADHYGGAATCNTQAICEGCGIEYGAYDPTNHINHMSDWSYLNETQHYRYCMGCSSEDTYVYADHYGGDGSCKPVCEGCGVQHYDPNGKHASMTDWRQYDDTQHYRYCDDCSQGTEYADHVAGSVPTCENAAYCSVCEEEFGATDPANHTDMTDWLYYDDTQHYRYCEGCFSEASYVYADHSGGDGSCRPVCEDCGRQYGNPDGKHVNMIDWFYVDDAQHYRYCADCGSEDSYEYVGHSPSDDSCKPFCEDCGLKYYNPNGKHSGLTDWFRLNDTQHARYCLTCQEDASDEYADHFGGDGSCKPFCEGCNTRYVDPDGKHVNITDWLPYDNAQHFRYCSDCSSEDALEYADHYGGDDSCSPVCEGCGISYANPDGKHLNMTDWISINDNQHWRYCQGCGSSDSYQYEDHSGGAATCSTLATCEGCGEAYGQPDVSSHRIEDGLCFGVCLDCGNIGMNLNGKHAIGGWKGYSSEQHARYCERCLHTSTYQYEDHYGTANCIGDAICDVCQSLFVSDVPNPDNHGDMSDWLNGGDTQHFSSCVDCGGNTVYADHDVGGGCYGTCTVCGETGVSAPGGKHEMTIWVSYNYTDHFRYCYVCYEPDTYEYAPHTGGVATCTENGVCKDCGEAYLPDLGHDWAWEPMGEGHIRVCQRPGCDVTDEDSFAAHVPAEDVCHVTTCQLCGDACMGEKEHTWGEWYIKDEDHHQHKCLAEGCYALQTMVHKYTIPGDCKNPATCVCGKTGEEPLGHDYKAVVTHPTCTTKGYTTHTCTRCGDSYQSDKISAIGHWYDLWQPNGDGTHSAGCKRSDCSHVSTVACTLYEVTVTVDGADKTLTVCPVCGDFDASAFPVVTSAGISAVQYNALPRGEQIIRGLDAPFNGALYAITAAYESAGLVEPFKGAVAITLPLDAGNYAAFTLVRVDVTPATETTARTETRTPIAHTLQHGKLTFQTNAPGLFLLVPAN